MTYEEIRKSPAVRAINNFIDSKYMLVIMALLALLSNVFSMEMPVYICLFAVSIYVCLFGKSVLFFAPLVSFAYVTPSMGNNPVTNSESIFYPDQQLYVLITMIVTIALVFFVRVTYDVGFVRFLKRPRKLLVGFLLLGLSFVLGGLGSDSYSILSLGYSLLLFVSLFLVYFLVMGAVDWTHVERDYVAWMGMLLAATVALELIYVYLSDWEAVYESGSIDRYEIMTGWGSRTSMGFVIAMGIPFAFYLACTKKYGFIFNIVGSLLLVADFVTCCRGSMLFGTLIYAVCMIPTIRCKMNRIGNLAVYATALISATIILFYYPDELILLFADILDPNLGDSGRAEIYADAIAKFQDSYLFGSGFYAADTGVAGSWYDKTGTFFLPDFWHNTILQMAAGCGIVGLCAYMFHRYQTVMLITNSPSLLNIFIALSILTLLLICMVDCHLFNIGGGLIYSALLPFAEGEEQMMPEKGKDNIKASFRHYRNGKLRADNTAL